MKVTEVVTQYEKMLTSNLVAADYLEDGGFYEAAETLRELVKTQLLAFCEWTASRYDLHEPFVRDKKLYATDARVMLRMPCYADDTPNVRVPKNLAELFEHYTSHQKQGDWRPWPEPKLSPSKNENNTGLTCPLCEGEGRYYNVDAFSCVYCDGTGELVSFESSDIGENKYAGRYLYLISLLPSVQYLPPAPDTPVYFRFGGGDGLLMPVRVTN